MAKIPTQRTGSGEWPDRKRISSGSGGKKGGCFGSASAIIAVSFTLLGSGVYGAAELISRI